MQSKCNVCYEYFSYEVSAKGGRPPTICGKEECKRSARNTNKKLTKATKHQAPSPSSSSASTMVNTYGARFPRGHRQCVDSGDESWEPNEPFPPPPKLPDAPAPPSDEDEEKAPNAEQVANVVATVAGIPDVVAHDIAKKAADRLVPFPHGKVAHFDPNTEYLVLDTNEVLYAYFTRCNIGEMTDDEWEKLKEMECSDEWYELVDSILEGIRRENRNESNEGDAQSDDPCPPPPKLSDVPAPPSNDDEADEGDEGDEGDDGWETIYNEDFEEWKTDDKGREYRDIHTYGGGPAGGYLLFRNGNVSAWHVSGPSSYEERRLQGDVEFKVDDPNNAGCAQAWKVRFVSA